MPIVAGGVVFDLWIGDPEVRPDKAMGYQACLNATDGAVQEGNVGAGAGATVGKLLGIKQAMKGGLGTASQKLENEIIVGALVVVNAFGDVIDPERGNILAGARDKDTNKPINTVEQMKKSGIRTQFLVMNTTIGVVATNAEFDREGMNKIAQVAHNGFAKTIAPVHTMVDGDTIFALSLGSKKADVNVIGQVATEVVGEAVIRAIKNAEGVAGIPAYRDIC